MAGGIAWCRPTMIGSGQRRDRPQVTNYFRTTAVRHRRCHICSARKRTLNSAKIPAVVAAAGLTPLNSGFVPLF
jgi:hypothetical protein